MQLEHELQETQAEKVRLAQELSDATSGRNTDTEELRSSCTVLEQELEETRGRLATAVREKSAMEQTWKDALQRAERA